MRVPKYYCPHCGRFKKRREVGFNMILHCKHCGSNILETEDMLTSYLNNVEEMAKTRKRMIKLLNNLSTIVSSQEDIIEWGKIIVGLEMIRGELENEESVLRKKNW